MENRQFNPGDIVVLRSGGPLMTITYLNAGYSERDVACSWFVDGDRKTDVFPPASLKHAEDN